MNNIDSELTETIASETIMSETIMSETIMSETIMSETIMSETIMSETKNAETSDLTNTMKKKTKSFSHNDKKQLVKRMGDIKSKNCFVKIFKLIYNTTKYTVNDNGVLFNLTTLPNDILTKIEQIIIYYEQKKIANETELKNNIAKNNAINDANNDAKNDSDYKIIY